jgi:predicted acetyltransferase
MKLVVPALDYLDGYRDALQRGWAQDNIRLEVAAREELAKIAEDPVAFVASLDDREAKGGPVTLPDGSKVPRLPGYRRWMWDGEFCGSIGFRWQEGTSALPPYVLGHIGYAIVPWKRRLGYATRALALMLDDARREGLDHVALTTDLDNEPSQRVILANGGIPYERFNTGPLYGNAEHLRFHIRL